MAKNQQHAHHNHIALKVPEGTVSGRPVRVGAYTGVALIDRLPDGTATVWLDGSWTIDVAGAAKQGDVVYITAAGTLTTTKTGNFPWGTAAADKSTGTAPLEVAPFGKNPASATAA